ncbi:MAG: Asp-tRNA(Asn)/Glu-tRNA(Gln) amidotransferase subunit GatB [Candidatus Eisenbacteria bacterium]
MAYEAVIGLECHIQLDTASKMFCDCPVEFGALPNTHTCPVCLGLPGALPRTNRAAVDAALRLGMALGCAIAERSVFARKHYFYPDMPKNYQITQYDRPLCEGGTLPVAGEAGARTFALTRVHLEEDTGKSFHPERIGDRKVSRVDFNRAGVPLLELVTEPVLRSPAEAAAFLTSLRRLVRWLGISGGDMEKGQLRCDANVSIREAGATALGTKTEIKNLNSIKGVERGLAAEIARQSRLLDAGERIVQATLLFDADHDKLAVMRTKEHAHDYRYFPDPDLPLLETGPAWRARVVASLPELPWAREARLTGTHGLPSYDAAVLCDSRELSGYFEAVARKVDAKLASNWMMTEMLRVLKARSESVTAWAARVPAVRFAALLRRIEDNEITGPNAKQVFEEMAESGADPAEIIAARGFRVQSSAAELLPVIAAVLDEHPEPVAQFLAGKTATFGFLVGQVMKRTGGQAAPAVVQELLRVEITKRTAAG